MSLIRYILICKSPKTNILILKPVNATGSKKNEAGEMAGLTGRQVT